MSAVQERAPVAIVMLEREKVLGLALNLLLGGGKEYGVDACAVGACRVGLISRNDAVNAAKPKFRKVATMRRWPAIRRQREANILLHHFYAFLQLPESFFIQSRHDFFDKMLERRCAGGYLPMLQ